MPLTVKQAAERLGVSSSLVYALIAARRIDHYRCGVGRGTIRIEETALEGVRRTILAGEANQGLTLKHIRAS